MTQHSEGAASNVVRSPVSADSESMVQSRPPGATANVICPLPSPPTEADEGGGLVAAALAEPDVEVVDPDDVPVEQAADASTTRAVAIARTELAFRISLQRPRPPKRLQPAPLGVIHITV